jgi:hypothetical protein
VYSDKGYLTKQLVELLLEGIWCKGVYLLKISSAAQGGVSRRVLIKPLGSERSERASLNC